MFGKKAPLNILAILEQPPLRSLTELPVIASFKKSFEEIPDFESIQSNLHTEQEYNSFSLEQRKKLPEAILAWFKTLQKKRRIKKFQEQLGAQASDLADIACSRYLDYVGKGKHMKAYFILGVLEKLTGKNKLKFPDKKSFRCKLLLL